VFNANLSSTSAISW